MPQKPVIFATGDAANAAADGEGHRTLMSCPHALPLGRSAGNNAAADLLGVPTFLTPRDSTGRASTWGRVAPS